MIAAILEVLGEATALFGTIGLAWLLANVIQARRIVRRGGVLTSRRGRRS